MIGEPAMSEVRQSNVVQFQRRGFCRCDRDATAQSLAVCVMTYLFTFCLGKKLIYFSFSVLFVVVLLCCDCVIVCLCLCLCCCVVVL